LSEIFLSYASADRARVAPLVHALEAEGLQLWWDRDIDSGQSFHKVIQQALTAAPAVIVVWTNESVQSEWVLNEASDARKRDRLVPVLLDPVTPPLEFRHLQAADLSDWKGDPADPQFTGLHKGLVAMLGQSDAPRPTVIAARPARQWWQTWPGQALGAGGFLIGLSVLVLTLRQVGIIGPPRQPLESTVVMPFQTSPVGAPAGKTDVKFDELKQAREKTAQSEQARVADVPPPVPAASATEPVNLLLDADLLYVNPPSEENWKILFTQEPTVTVISTNGFAVLALRGDKAVTFDTLAISVHAAFASAGVKELAIYISSTSPEGPFVKAAQITVPLHRDLKKLFQDFHFAPVQARFVKLQVLSSHHSAPAAYVGSIQLYASHTNGR
jgi:hypothetical protein